MYLFLLFFFFISSDILASNEGKIFTFQHDTVFEDVPEGTTKVGVYLHHTMMIPEPYLAIVPVPGTTPDYFRKIHDGWQKIDLCKGWWIPAESASWCQESHSDHQNFRIYKHDPEAKVLAFGVLDVLSGAINYIHAVPDDTIIYMTGAIGKSPTLLSLVWGFNLATHQAMVFGPEKYSHELLQMNTFLEERFGPQGILNLDIGIGMELNITDTLRQFYTYSIQGMRGGCRVDQPRGYFMHHYYKTVDRLGNESWHLMDMILSKQEYSDGTDSIKTAADYKDFWARHFNPKLPTLVVQNSQGDWGVNIEMNQPSLFYGLAINHMRLYLPGTPISFRYQQLGFSMDVHERVQSAYDFLRSYCAQVSEHVPFIMHVNPASQDMAYDSLGAFPSVERNGLNIIARIIRMDAEDLDFFDDLVSPSGTTLMFEAYAALNRQNPSNFLSRPPLLSLDSPTLLTLVRVRDEVECRYGREFSSAKPFADEPQVSHPFLFLRLDVSAFNPAFSLAPLKDFYKTFLHFIIDSNVEYNISEIPEGFIVSGEGLDFLPGFQEYLTSRTIKKEDFFKSFHDETAKMFPQMC